MGSTDPDRPELIKLISLIICCACSLCGVLSAEASLGDPCMPAALHASITAHVLPWNEMIGHSPKEVKPAYAPLTAD